MTLKILNYNMEIMQSRPNKITKLIFTVKHFDKFNSYMQSKNPKAYDYMNNLNSFMQSVAYKRKYMPCPVHLITTKFTRNNSLGHGVHQAIPLSFT